MRILDTCKSRQIASNCLQKGAFSSMLTLPRKGFSQKIIWPFCRQDVTNIQSMNRWSTQRLSSSSTGSTATRAPSAWKMASKIRPSRCQHTPRPNLSTRCEPCESDVVDRQAAAQVWRRQSPSGGLFEKGFKAAGGRTEGAWPLQSFPKGTLPSRGGGLKPPVKSALCIMCNKCMIYAAGWQHHVLRVLNTVNDEKVINNDNSALFPSKSYQVCTHQYVGPLFLVEFTDIYCESMMMSAASRRSLSEPKRQLYESFGLDMPRVRWHAQRVRLTSHPGAVLSDTPGPRNRDSLSVCTSVCTSVYICIRVCTSTD